MNRRKRLNRRDAEDAEVPLGREGIISALGRRLERRGALGHTPGLGIWIRVGARFGLVLLVAAVVGCAVGPDYVPPEISAPQA